MLPRIKIYFENGALGQVPASADGVLGHLCTGAAVSTTFALATPYTLYSYDSLVSLGVNTTNNPSLCKLIKEFYDEAGDGTETWVMAFPDTVKLSDMLDTTATDKAKALINAANGRLRGLLVSRTPAAAVKASVSFTVTNAGADTDTVNIKYNTVDVVTYTRGAGTLSVADVAAEIAEAINGTTGTSGITATSTGAAITILAPIGGAGENGKTVLLTIGGGDTIAFDTTTQNMAGGSGYSPTITNGLDADVALARANGQLLATWAKDTKYAPVFVVIEGYAYDGNPVNLTDLTTESHNSVSVFIGDTVNNSPNAAMGLIGGRIAKNAVHENIGAVVDGPVAAVSAYIKNKPVEQADVESIHNKGYITLRSFVGRSGYFFTDDPTATLPTDDYNHLTARRTIDKAYRIAYATLLPKLLTAVPVNADGTLQAALVKSWQGDVEQAIVTQMTANGELSADATNPNDKGVVCYINAAQNVVSTSKVDITIRVRPFGYPRYIDVYLGFQVVGN